MDISKILYFAVNVSDLTRLNKQQSILINDKLTNRQVNVRKSAFDDGAVLLKPTVPNECSGDITGNQQLYATCEILSSEKYSVRSYYSTNGKAFHQFKFEKKVSIGFEARWNDSKDMLLRRY